MIGRPADCGRIEDFLARVPEVQGVRVFCRRVHLVAGMAAEAGLSVVSAPSRSASEQLRPSQIKYDGYLMRLLRLHQSFAIGRFNRRCRRPEAAFALSQYSRGGSVPESQSITSGIAGRYAVALFELCSESGIVEQLERDCLALQEAIDVSDEFNRLLLSPIYRSEDMSLAVSKIGERMGLAAPTQNTLALMAMKRRLFALPSMIKSVNRMIAHSRGIIGAQITTAQPLAEEKAAQLELMLSSKLGQKVKLEMAVDPSLIGGFVVGIGSRIFDGSIKSKLERLQNVLKEVT